MTFNINEGPAKIQANKRDPLAVEKGGFEPLFLFTIGTEKAVKQISNADRSGAAVDADPGHR